MLIAQVRIEGVSLLTRDETLGIYRGPIQVL